MNSSPARQYFHAIRNLLDKAEATQLESLHHAGELIAQSLAQGGMLHVFGSGHSHLLAEELFARAGSLSPINAILDPALMIHQDVLWEAELERQEDYAAELLSNQDLRPSDVMLVISNSGRNAVPIEVGLLAKERGLTVIALTSLAHSSSVATRHSGGKRLFEIADLVLDNQSPSGDAALRFDGLRAPICATSTVLGAALLEALLAETALQLQARGIVPPVIISSNLDGADQANESLIAQHGKRLSDGHRQPI